MTRAIAHMFLLLYLCATTEAYQVLKFPVILQHFHEHQKENKDISFLEFLDIHYMHGSPRDADYERDMQLPFKKANHHVNISPVHVVQVATAPIEVQSFPQQQQFIIRDDQRIYSKFLSAIFQPPRA